MNVQSSLPPLTGLAPPAAGESFGDDAPSAEDGPLPQSLPPPEPLLAMTGLPPPVFLEPVDALLVLEEVLFLDALEKGVAVSEVGTGANTAATALW